MDTDNNNEEKTPAKKVRRQPTQEELNHPLHGVKLATVLETLVEVYGWKYLAQEVNIKCFKHDPSIKVSLKFLRKFTWAREHVQDIYVDMVEQGIDQKVKKKEENSVYDDDGKVVNKKRNGGR